mmetsp:Transcript_110251/g.235457  ORF Transcript_110251/g.235457 Transcript_110251/m.235457 type:complete len:991 (-) Transcript_110251:99-3071(-)
MKDHFAHRFPATPVLLFLLHVFAAPLAVAADGRQCDVSHLVEQDACPSRVGKTLLQSQMQSNGVPALHLSDFAPPAFSQQKPDNESNASEAASNGSQAARRDAEEPLEPGLTLPDSDESQVMMVANIECNQTLFAPTGACPKNCPYFTEDPAKVCHFRCVKASQCGSMNPKNTVPDAEGKFCRPCKVPGCDRCSPGGVDTCAKCASGYIHAKDGHCYSAAWVVWMVIFALVGVVGLFLLGWYVSLRLRPVVNSEGLTEGLSYRSRLKLRMPDHTMMPGMEPPEGANPGRQLWPMSTSLHDVDVAGPGLLLHYNFHLAIIIWACICASAWIVYAYSTEPELLLLGLYSASTPQDLCAVTIHGKKAQHQMMWAKVTFVILAYMGTFVACMLYGIYHVRKYHDMDAATTSMRDFAVLCTGLPTLTGAEKVEEQIAQAVKEASGETVIGVSVCWDFRTVAEDVNNAIDKEDTKRREVVQPIAAKEEAEDEPVRRSCGLYRKIDGIFGFGGPEEEEEQTDDSVEELLHNMKSSDAAFVVFPTESARDSAVQWAKQAGGLRFRGESVQLEAVPNEPDTVCWEIFSIASEKIKTRAFVGIATVLAAVVVWCGAFYLPYAYYTASFSAAHNEEPGFLAGLTFTMLVVGGNQAMYFLCNEISYRVGFRFTDDAEAFYIALYTFACFLNLVVDLIMEFMLGYNAMVAADVHTADGRLLGDLTSYQEIFESYPMQKALGRRLFDYCFPSTFFIPFVFEPLFAIYMPYHLMKLLVRTHKNVRGREAEKSFEFFLPMDLGRYGDLVLNVILTSLIFFFPAGEMLKLFLALICSHIFIYFYDKYRILRAGPGFCFAGNSADNCTQAILAIPCGFMAACAVFKGNCLDMSPYCIHEDHLFEACCGAFITHVAFHWLCLFYVVPRFAREEKDQAEHEYSHVAPTTPCTWFSANPVHCLRSKHIYAHSPPCRHFSRGQEHLMQANPAIGCYFEEGLETATIKEDFSY